MTMKRIISFILLMHLSICCFSQISRTFWGVTLGKSTKQQVRAMLISKKYKVHSEIDGSLVVYPNNVSFGGAFWTYVGFGFVNGRLQGVLFQNNSEQAPIDVDETYEKLLSSLNNKYGSCIKDFPSENACIFSDLKTSTSLSRSERQGVNIISLFYTDVELTLKDAQSDEDEL